MGAAAVTVIEVPDVEVPAQVTDTTIPEAAESEGVVQVIVVVDT